MTDEAKNTRTPSIVLVHGAFADGSSWRPVIAILEDQGYRVTAVQNPQTSFREDVAMTRRVVEAQQGPVVLVGHSYGGAVITAAALGAENVKALVYVAAFAPDAGERLQTLLMAYPSELAPALVSDSEGYLSIDRTKFGKVFADDVPERERRVMAAVQKPINGQIFTQVFGTPAWMHLPAWYLIATEDQAINPALQRMFAARMDATIHEVKTSHVPFVSNPVAVDRIIRVAAASIDRTAKPSGQAVARLHIEHVVQRASAKPTIH
jgi:pimeloyl-ACP methyl ester carboxylesterase